MWSPVVVIRKCGKFHLYNLKSSKMIFLSWQHYKHQSGKTYKRLHQKAPWIALSMVRTKQMFYTGGRAPNASVGRQKGRKTAAKRVRHSKKLRRNRSDSTDLFYDSCCSRYIITKLICISLRTFQVVSRKLYVNTLLFSRVRWLCRLFVLIFFCMFRGVFRKGVLPMRTKTKNKKDPVGKWKPQTQIKLKLDPKNSNKNLRDKTTKYSTRSSSSIHWTLKKNIYLFI